MYGSPQFAAPAPYYETALTSGTISRRIFAWLIDLFIVTVIVGVLFVALFVLGIVTFGLAWPLLGVLPAVPLLYGWLSVASQMSATPGQALVGLVVRRNEDLGDPGALRAFATTALFYLTLATSLGVIWFAVAVVTNRRRTLHDILSGTVVVNRLALTAGAPSWNMRTGGWPAA